MSKQYEIEGLKCAGCANTVKEQFSHVAGVENVDVDLATKTAIVTGNYDEKALADSLQETPYAVK
ncbi:heavy-metal-associated domain-containing protein [Pisciglobus halotolerans]|uniref:Heavy-metal-associated domain-containing protein n=1 Tax=Pisciglobus halotolerans TaxID=745365 RepID=A0A1I3B228_9LACT|nr:heavy metal-associated domain-containing protein [Pisciglobus halotolerans]SFH56367.1 Heavy-metal-associated domain-containing protein [Pisciglobus halotolerans]